MAVIRVLPNELVQLSEDLQTASRNLQTDTEHVLGLLSHLHFAWLEDEEGTEYMKRAEEGIRNCQELREALDGLSRRLSEVTSDYLLDEERAIAKVSMRRA